MLVVCKILFGSGTVGTVKVVWLRFGLGLVFIWGKFLEVKAGVVQETVLLSVGFRLSLLWCLMAILLKRQLRIVEILFCGNHLFCHGGKLLFRSKLLPHRRLLNTALCFYWGIQIPFSFDILFFGHSLQIKELIITEIRHLAHRDVSGHVVVLKLTDWPVRCVIVEIKMRVFGGFAFGWVFLCWFVWDFSVCAAGKWTAVS